MPRKPFLAMALASSLLAGCATVPQADPGVRQATPASLGLSGLPSTPGQAAVPAEWWSTMGDPQLDRIMADALAGSPTVDEAMARLRIARAAIGAGQAALLPQLTASASEQRQRFSARSIVPPPYGGSSQWVGSTEADLDWSLDLAGRQKAAVAAARASADAAALDLAAARIVLAGSVAQAYVNLARADRLAAIAAEFTRSRETALQLAETRKRTSLGSDFEVSAAQALLAEARQAQIRAAGQRSQMVHLLAALAGRGVDYYPTIGAPSLRLDAAWPVPAALPADLLARRPDIQAAQARIAAAEAGRRQARAAFYPDVDLHAFVGTAALGLGSLFSAGALTAGIGPAIHLPIFEGGKLAAGYRGAVGELDLAVATYDRLVTEAVRQGADALSAVETHAADSAQQRTVVAELENTVRLDAVRVRTGLASRLDVLDANDRLLAARQAQAGIDADGAVSRVQLLVALGGGFVPSQSPPCPCRPGKPGQFTDHAMNTVSHDFDRDRASPAAAPEAPGTGEPTSARTNRARRRGLLLLGGAVALGLVGYGAHTLLSGDSESTDDAYVAGHVVTITAREPGNVVTLHADNTESVRAGQPLVDLDPATADAQLAAAEADLARAVRAVRAGFSQVAEGQAEIGSAEVALSKARNDLVRRQQAAAAGAISGEEVTHAADDVASARAALALAQSRRTQALSAVSGTDLRNNPQVLAAIAALRRAAIVESHMHITAPVDGIVAQRSVQLGQQVTPGAPLMAVVPLRDVWIDANFRETQLADLRVGQPARVTSDAYGSHVVFHGRVVGLGAGSGNAFALLPPQNASGNWIKITQRLPVRIALDPAELARNPLRVGLSANVTVDTSDHSGAPVARAAAGPTEQAAGQDGGAAVERLIDRIIATNGGGAPRHGGHGA